jgi:dTDP-4-dehydrorhamnose 3,5-epimerase
VSGVRFTETALPGVWIVDVEPSMDERGFFARCWCARELAERGLEGRTVQCSLSFNQRRGTVRGLHYVDPALSREAKVVRCVRGAIWDVVADVRPGSATYGRWVGLELSQANRRAIYVPPGLAHGYQTLADETELFYQMSDYYLPGAARSVRWDDPMLAIGWPLEMTVISEADRTAPGLQP